MSRIISGTLRGRKLTVPQSGTRPTSDRVKEALFSRLEHYDLIDGSTILDLFAGSGGLAFEALSRGGARAVLVDVSAGAVRSCQDNISALGIKNQTEVHQMRAEQYLSRQVPAQPDVSESSEVSDSPLFDVIFLDPPYALANDDLLRVLELLALPGMLSDHGAIVLERDRRSPELELPAGLVSFDQRKYGDSAVWLLESA